MAVDLAVIFCFLFFLWRGSSRGFLKSILGPFTFLAATATAFYYYQTTKNIPIAISIGLLGPMALYWLGVCLINSFGSTTNPPLLSRILGAVITVAWGMFIILPIVFVLTLLPPIHPSIASLNKNILKSCTYLLLKPVAKAMNLPVMTQAPIVAPSNNPSVPSATPKTNPALQALAEDERIQDILNDPVIIKAIQDKDFASLMANPKILKLTQDPELLKKMLNAYAQMGADSSSVSSINLR